MTVSASRRARKHGKIEARRRAYGIVADHYGYDGSRQISCSGGSSDILAQRQIVHAATDLDALGLAHLPSAAAMA